MDGNGVYQELTTFHPVLLGAILQAHKRVASVATAPTSVRPAVTVSLGAVANRRNSISWIDCKPRQTLSYI
jgi:hypothetical protein